MKRVAALLLVVGFLIAMATAVDASTSSVARLGSHGGASLRIGAPDHLTISVTDLRPSTRYAVTLRRGTCSTLGTLVLTSRITTSAEGAGKRTISLTAAQTTAARLPLAIRVGSRCAAFKAPAIIVPPGASPSASPSASTTASPSASPSASTIPNPMPSPYTAPMSWPSM
jgi:hypothetical protein